MGVNITVGAILRGKYPSNNDQRALVWAFNPNNPKRVLLWSKSGRFAWNWVASVEGNYENAPTDEPAWGGPTRPPPVDPTDGAKNEATPVEQIAASAPTSEPTLAPAVEPAPPSPTPPAANDDETITVTLSGEPASRLLSLVDYLKTSLRGTGARITFASLIEDLVEREYESTVKNLVKRELAAIEGKVA